MTYMVAAYMIIWFASFVLIFSMVRRQQNIERDLASIKEVAQNREQQR
jgi:CcmD family protein